MTREITELQETDRGASSLAIRPMVNDQPDLLLVEEIKRIMKEEGITNASLSRETGIASSTLSEVLTGKYKGEVGPRLKSLQAWLDDHTTRREMGKQLPKAPEWVDTRTSRAITDVLDYTRAVNGLSVIYGRAGVGKTMTIKKFATERNRIRFCSFGPHNGTVRDSLATIAEAVGLNYVARGRGKDYLVRQIEPRLDESVMLILDEAQHLKSEAIEQIRYLHDRCGCSVVFVGNFPLYSRLYGRKTLEYEQVFGRITAHHRIDRPHKDDIEALAHAWGVTNAAAIDVLHETAQKDGSLRGVSHTIGMAVFRTSKPASEISVSELKKARAARGLG